MSFSGEVKKELALQAEGARHCLLAELAAVIIYAGSISISDGVPGLKLETGNAMLKKKYGLLLRKLFPEKEVEGDIKGEDVCGVLESVKMWDGRKGCFTGTDMANGLLIQQSCCRRAFIRGAFLASGSMSSPDKSYHFEIVCRTMRQAEQLQYIIRSFDIDARIAARKKHFIVYMKEGEDIVDILNIMEAHIALMSLENVRIVKEMRNSINRQVNCETANISKTVNAAVRQIEDIRLIQEKTGLESLPDNLREIALLRLEYPDMALKELGAYLNPPIGKSGVNHRLRKISELAEKLKMSSKDGGLQ